MKQRGREVKETERNKMKQKGEENEQRLKVEENKGEKEERRHGAFEGISNME